MSKKAIETLRNGLEDSHWYSDDDEKIFNELVIKARAFDRIVEEVKITEFEIREKELVSSDVGYRSLGKEIARFVTKEVNQNES